MYLSARSTLDLESVPEGVVGRVIGSQLAHAITEVLAEVKEFQTS